MDNNPKKRSKAFIITFILILLLLIAGYFLLFKDGGIMNSTGGSSRLFSSLFSSKDTNGGEKTLALAGEEITNNNSIYVSGYVENTESIPVVFKVDINDPNSSNPGNIYGIANQDIRIDNLGKVTITDKNNQKIKLIAQGGEDIKDGDEVYISKYTKYTKRIPIVMNLVNNDPNAVKNNNIFGYANQYLKNDSIGEVTLTNGGGTNTFWDSFFGYLGKKTTPVVDKPVATNPQINIENGLWKGIDPFSDPRITIENNVWMKTNPSDGKMIFENGLWKRIDQDGNTITETGVWNNENDVWNRAKTLSGEEFDPYRFPIVNVTATPSSFKTEGEATISWTSKNADSCNAGAGNGTGTEGSFKTGLLKKSKMFTVVCKGLNSSSGGNAFVLINGVDNFPKITVSATPASFEKEGTSTITWTSTNAKTCNAGLGNGTGTEGSFKTKLLTESTSFNITCTGDGGSASKNVLVIVTNNANNSGIIRQCSDGIDNDGDKLIDELDPNCHINGDLNKPYVANHFSELTSPTSASILLNDDGTCKNDATNPPLCSTNTRHECINGADNPPRCNTLGGECMNDASNPPACTITNTKECINGADNPMLCTTLRGVCINSATNPPACTITDTKECINGADNPPSCTTFEGKCFNGKDNPPDCNATADIPELEANISPSTIKKGESSTITWESKNAKSCKLSGGGISGEGLSNLVGISTGALTKNTSYMIICVGKSGSRLGKTLRVIVEDDKTTLPTVTATANPSTIDTKEISTIDWTSTNSVVCDAGIGNGTGTEGSFEVGPLDKTKSFVISCSNAKGNKANATVVVTVNSASLPVCNDGIDNDKDGKIDRLDPQCHTDENVNNLESYVPNHFSETTKPTDNGKKKPQCSDEIDNDRKGDVDTEDPECHSDGNARNPDSYLPLYNSESSSPVECNDTIDNSDPDKLIDAADPECHVGGKLTGVYVPTHISENFPPDKITECNDKINNDKKEGIDIDDPQCHSDGNVKNINSYIPNYNSESISPTECNDTIDNSDPDKLIDAADPECLDANGKYLPTHFSETNSSVANPAKQCDLIAHNPLTFTNSEKARLAVLLRKFYLISSTFKTNEDIIAIYNEIDQQNTFIGEIKDLINQCYVEVGTAGNPKNPNWTRRGNPWYMPVINGVQTYGTSYDYPYGDKGYYVEYNDSRKTTGANIQAPLLERILKIW